MTTPSDNEAKRCGVCDQPLKAIMVPMRSAQSTLPIRYRLDHYECPADRRHITLAAS